MHSIRRWRHVALFYETGNGVMRDLRSAVKWYKSGNGARTGRCQGCAQPAVSLGGDQFERPPLVGEAGARQSLGTTPTARPDGWGYPREGLSATRSDPTEGNRTCMLAP
jgi:hypothetical protein